MTRKRLAGWGLAGLAAAAALVFAPPVLRGWAAQRAFMRNIRGLEALRRAVSEYSKRNGRCPARLEDAGMVPPLQGLAKAHPGSQPSRVLEASLEWVTLEAVFWHPFTEAGAWLVGAWGGGAMERNRMRCDRTPAPDGPAAGGCWVRRAVQPGRALYGIFPGDAGPSLGLTERDISLRYPHGEGIISADAGGTVVDAGQWSYDPAACAVFIACTHDDLGPRGGLPLYKY